MATVALFALFLSVGLMPHASEAASVLAGRNLRIAVSEYPPFAIADRTKQGNEIFTGFDMDIIKELSDRLGFQYTYFDTPALTPVIQDIVKQRKYDAVVGGLSITLDRERITDFTFPYTTSGLQLFAAPVQQASSAFLLFEPFSWDLWLFLLGITVVGAVLVVVYERRNASTSGSLQYQKTIPVAALEGLWWSATAMVGGAEEQPRSAQGRIVAVSWGLISTVIIAMYTANLATLFAMRQQTSEVNGLGDLTQQTVGVENGSLAVQYLVTRAAYGIRIAAYPQLEDAVAAMALDRPFNGYPLKAVLGDSAVLVYLANHGYGDEGTLAGAILEQRQVGIMLRNASIYRDALNEGILGLIADGTRDDIQITWFGYGSGGSADAGGPSATLSVIDAGLPLGVMVIFAVGLSAALFWCREHSPCVNRSRRREKRHQLRSGASTTEMGNGSVELAERSARMENPLHAHQNTRG